MPFYFIGIAPHSYEIKTLRYGCASARDENDAKASAPFARMSQATFFFSFDLCSFMVVSCDDLTHKLSMSFYSLFVTQLLKPYKAIPIL